MLLLDTWVLFWLVRISIEDIRSFTIPNRYTLAILAAALLFPAIPISSRLLAAALPLVLIPFMGMGDVKLYSALGFMLGLRDILRIACISMLAGGVCAAILLAAKKIKKKDRIAFGPFIAAAAAFVLLWPSEETGILLLSRFL